MPTTLRLPPLATLSTPWSVKVPVPAIVKSAPAPPAAMVPWLMIRSPLPYSVRSAAAPPTWAMVTLLPSVSVTGGALLSKAYSVEPPPAPPMSMVTLLSVVVP